MTNVAKILLLQDFFIIRRKLFDFRTFVNQTHIIHSTDIIIYFTDTYYLYHSNMYRPKPELITPLLKPF